MNPKQVLYSLERFLEKKHKSADRLAEQQQVQDNGCEWTSRVQGCRGDGIVHEVEILYFFFDILKTNYS
jgi:hypothetical protein